MRYLNANIQEHGGHVFCIKKSLKILNKELMRTGESKDRQSSSQAKKTRNNLQTLHRNFRLSNTTFFFCADQLIDDSIYFL